MKTKVGQVGLIGVLLLVPHRVRRQGPPPGGPAIRAPAIVEEPPVYQWSWWGWPHYDVEHRYVVDNDHVAVHDRHYFPFFGSTRLHQERRREAQGLVQAHRLSSVPRRASS